MAEENVGSTDFLNSRFSLIHAEHTLCQPPNQTLLIFGQKFSRMITTYCAVGGTCSPVWKAGRDATKPSIQTCWDPRSEEQRRLFHSLSFIWFGMVHAFLYKEQDRGYNMPFGNSLQSCINKDYPLRLRGLRTLYRSKLRTGKENQTLLILFNYIHLYKNKNMILPAREAALLLTGPAQPPCTLALCLLSSIIL